MNEYSIGTIFSLSLLGLIISSTLYWIGGRSNKWIRRYLASLVLALTVNLSSYFMDVWNIWLLLIYPILCIAFSLGYGAENITEKLIKRTFVCIAVTSAGLIFCLTIGGNTWYVYALHVGVGFFSIFLGVKNMLVAVAEEGIICTLLNAGLICYPFVMR